MKKIIGIALLVALCVLAWRTTSLLNERKVALDGLPRTTKTAQPPAVKAASAASGANAAVATREIGHGLTFGRIDDPANGTQVQLSCQAEAGELARPDKGVCNMTRGDTSCRTVLPVACIQTASGSIAATPPIMGALIKSAQVGSARCTEALGSGWRMAEVHDGTGGRIAGARGAGMQGSTRYWIHVNNLPGNCWDSPP